MTSDGNTSKVESGDPPAAGRARRWAFRLATLGLAMVVGLGVAEGLLWALAPVGGQAYMEWIPDGHVRGRGRPRQTFDSHTGCDARINRLGFRGPDYEWAPAPGTLRVLTLGGSSTFGVETVEEGSTWPAQLEARLAASLEAPVEVVNLALPGFTSFDSKINYLYLGRAYHPHVVVCYHTWNDIKRFRLLGRSPFLPAGTVRDKPWWERVLRRTQLGRRAGRAYAARQAEIVEDVYTSLEREGAGAAQPASATALTWSRRNFEDIVSFAQHDDVLPVLVTQATIAVPENADRKEYRLKLRCELAGMTFPVICATWLQMNAVLQDVAERTGAVFVDAYAAVPHDLEHLRDQVHLTDEGRARVAEVIAETLLADSRFREVAKRVQNPAPHETPRHALAPFPIFFLSP